MDALLELPDLPANAELLAWLREQADEPSGPDDYVLGGWQLHTHPDLLYYLRSCAPGWPLTAAYGIPILACKGVAAVAAIGTDFLAVRTDELPPGVEIIDQAGWFPSAEWHAIWAWGQEGTILGLVTAALGHAGSLGAT
jgi:hypothetical protein